MSNSINERNFQDFKPTARKGLRDTPNIDLRTEMGRFGMETTQKGKSRKNGIGSPKSQSQQGIDEVDNIMSKPMRLESTLPSRMHKQRHTSISENDDDDDDESFAEELNWDSSRSINSTNNYSQDILSPNSIDTSHSNRSNHSSPRGKSRAPEKEASNNLGYFIAVITAVAALVAAVYWYGSETNTSTSDDVMFSRELNNIRMQYNIDEDSILKMKSGILGISKLNIAGSLIFAYNSRKSNFNVNQFNNFMNNVALSTAKYLRNKSVNQYTSLNSRSLHMSKHEELIEMYRHKVEETGVLLVEDLDRLPSDLAMAFHYFCDEYDPLVKKSAVLFTVDLSRCEAFKGQPTVHALLEKCLENKWRTVNPDNVKPLLARVVSVVIDVST